MTTSHYSEKVIRSLPLLSAWGTAVERGEDSGKELAALRNLGSEDPETLKDMIRYSIEFQSIMRAQPGDVSESDPRHPSNRLARVETLRTILAL